MNSPKQLMFDPIRHWTEILNIRGGDRSRDFRGQCRPL
jgi:hypothetical protein